VLFRSDCQEDGSGTELYCRICGAQLSERQEESSGTISEAEGLTALLELFGEGMRDMINASIERSGPERSISIDYLKSIGEIQVDKRKGILLDACLIIGPLKVMCVIAQFGPLPISTCLESRIVRANPEFGEEVELINAVDCVEKIVLMRRGVVSFCTKAIRAQSAGASAVIVMQTADKWPFVMTDSASELKDDINIPVVMIGKQDSELLEGFLKNGKAESSMIDEACSESIASVGIEATLKFESLECECSICQEEIEEGAIVIKLPCRHHYHKDCVMGWLEKNNTCPLCRKSMPVATSAELQLAERRRRDANSSASSMPYFN